jgi:hypothetical protein
MLRIYILISTRTQLTYRTASDLTPGQGPRLWYSLVKLTSLILSYQYYTFM